MALEGDLSCIRWDSWGKVALGLLLSTAAGFFAARAARHGLSRLCLSPRLCALAQVPGAACTAFLHGAQDGQKFLGVFLLGAALAQDRGDEGTFWVPLWLMVLCALFMALGTALGGRRIIDTVARDMVSLTPRDALCSDLGSIPCLLLSTALGLPVSTTHTRTAALLGAAGAVPRWGVAGRIALAWLLTFPGCLAIGYWLARLALALFP